MAHVHEKIDFTVAVFIVYGNRVLLRLHDKYKLWLAVGGHIDLGEDPNEAAVREVKEEVGLDVVLWEGNRKFDSTGGQYMHKELIPPVGLHRHRVNDIHEHVDMVYFATTQTDQVIPENQDDEWKWLTKDEVNAMDLLPDVKFYAELALDTIHA